MHGWRWMLSWGCNRHGSPELCYRRHSYKGIFESGLSPCDNRKVCINEVGFFECVCPNGTKSDDNGEACIDIDECRFGADNCPDTALCINNFGSFECECSAGYVGDGIECVDVDECTFAATDSRSVCCKCDVLIQRTYLGWIWREFLFFLIKVKYYFHSSLST